ncbi:MAG: hypothetical protein MZV70_44440 [Desulfobacterales bacterium]|nr:hypothetical protein [Desulfobacterales bacterium]
MKGSRQYMHRPHPGKEAKKYQVEELREWFITMEVKTMMNVMTCGVQSPR